jgi:transcriptional regulator
MLLEDEPAPHGRLIAHLARANPQWKAIGERTSARAEPWAVDDAPEPYIAAELRAIVGIEIAIERFDAKWKLSQNREERDFAGVRDGLAASADAGDRAVAHAIDRFAEAKKVAEKGI